MLSDTRGRYWERDSQDRFPNKNGAQFLSKVFGGTFVEQSRPSTGRGLVVATDEFISDDEKDEQKYPEGFDPLRDYVKIDDGDSTEALCDVDDLCAECDRVYAELQKPHTDGEKDALRWKLRELGEEIEELGGRRRKQKPQPMETPVEKTRLKWFLARVHKGVALAQKRAASAPKPAAKTIREIAVATATAKPAEAPAREFGTVKRYVAKGGYGFITTAKGVDVFMHVTAIASEAADSIREGASVTFTVAQTPKGPQARDVRLASATAPKPVSQPRNERHSDRRQYHGSARRPAWLGGRRSSQR
jgi:cold shock protein